MSDSSTIHTSDTASRQFLDSSSVHRSADSAVDVATPARRRPNRFSLPGDTTVDVARDVQGVMASWRLVYQAYLQTGLIDPNPYRLHATPAATDRDTLVLMTRRDGDLVSTVTVMPDADRGLPLDAVYQPELDLLRRTRRIAEVGLLADRRDQEAVSFGAVFEIMRMAFYYGVHSGVDDLVIGVHPHHEGFYRRYIGFESCGPLRLHPTVKDHPAVLLRLRVAERLQEGDLPKGLQAFAENPEPASTYADRFRFPANEVNGSLIGRMLRAKAQQGHGRSLPFAQELYEAIAYAQAG